MDQLMALIQGVMQKHGVGPAAPSPMVSQPSFGPTNPNVGQALLSQPLHNDQGETMYGDGRANNYDWSQSKTGKLVEQNRDLVKAQIPPLQAQAPFVGPQRVMGEGEDNFNPTGMTKKQIDLLVQMMKGGHLKRGG